MIVPFRIRKEEEGMEPRPRWSGLQRPEEPPRVVLYIYLTPKGEHKWKPINLYRSPFCKAKIKRQLMSVEAFEHLLFIRPDTIIEGNPLDTGRPEGWRPSKRLMKILITHAVASRSCSHFPQWALPYVPTELRELLGLSLPTETSSQIS